MQSPVRLRPKQVAPKKPAAQIPLDDVEAAALYLVEIMPPGMRRELARLLAASAPRSEHQLKVKKRAAGSNSTNVTTISKVTRSLYGLARDPTRLR